MAAEPTRTIRRLRRLGWWIRTRASDTITFRTVQGTITFSAHDKVMGRHTYMHRGWEHDWYERAVAFARSMHPMPPRGRGTFLDLGANVGIIGIGAVLGGDFARAVAVEPDPGNFGLLCRNVRQNGLEDRVRCFNCALADREQEALLQLSARNHGDHRVRRLGDASAPAAASVKVTVRPLDAVMHECGGDWDDDLAMAWIDVQGFEGWVFRGSTRILGKGIPIVSEIMPQAVRESGMTPRDFCELLGRTHGSVWMPVAEGWTRRPVGDLPGIFAEIEGRGSHENVVFLP